jgi:antitoxin VapB
MHIYSVPMTTSTKAKLFRNGGSQAVRLPKGCRFPENQREVLVRREGRRVILEPVDTWSDEFLTCLGALARDEEIPRLKQIPITKLRNPLE